MSSAVLKQPLAMNLRPRFLQQFDQAMQNMARGETAAPLSSRSSSGEIARLIEHFLRLARIQQKIRPQLLSQLGRWRRQNSARQGA